MKIFKSQSKFSVLNFCLLMFPIDFLGSEKEVVSLDDGAV
jgi:hypothetical protein